MKEYILTEEDLSGMQLSLIDSFKELVMCKDCKHHHDDTQCSKRIGIWFNDDYCSGAERKETQDD